MRWTLLKILMGQTCGELLRRIPGPGGYLSGFHQNSELVHRLWDVLTPQNASRRITAFSEILTESLFYSDSETTGRTGETRGLLWF